MNKRNRTDEKVDAILQVFNTIEKAEAPPFFTEKLLQRIGYEEWESSASSSSRGFKWALAGVALLIGVNCTLIIDQIQSGSSNQMNREESLESFGQDYLFLDTDNY